MLKHYQQMDPSLRKQLLEGVEDTLTPLVEERRKFLEGRCCPKCGMDGCVPTVDPRRPFGGELLPKTHLACPNCGLEFDPYTGIQHNLGGVPQDAARVSQALFIKK